MSENCGRFSDHTFLLILPPKKHSFLEKLIGEYIKVLVFSFFGDIHQNEITQTGHIAENAAKPLAELQKGIIMHKNTDSIVLQKK